MTIASVNSGAAAPADVLSPDPAPWMPLRDAAERLVSPKAVERLQRARAAWPWRKKPDAPLGTPEYREKWNSSRELADARWTVWTELHAQLKGGQLLARGRPGGMEVPLVAIRPEDWRFFEPRSLTGGIVMSQHKVKWYAVEIARAADLEPRNAGGVSTLDDDGRASLVSRIRGFMLKLALLGSRSIARPKSG